MTTVNKEENQEDKRSFLGFFNSTKEEDKAEQENKEESKEENKDDQENKDEQESIKVKIPNCESLLNEMRECTKKNDGTHNCKKEIDEWEKNCKKNWFPIVR